MPMELVETTILADAVYMRLADPRGPDEAEYWIEFRVPLNELTLPTAAGDQPLEDIERRYFGLLQLAALRYARERLSAETQGLADRLSR
jgi:hypothetical protein